MIHPVIQDNLIMVLVADCGMDGRTAAAVSKRVILGLQRVGMDIVRGDWMADAAVPMEAPDKWTTLARDAVEWIESGASPMNRPELR